VTRTLRAALAATLTLLVLVVGTASANSTPIGKLPPGPTSSHATKAGQYVAVSLPRQPAKSGLVWRLARPVNAKVLRQVSEADVGPTVVVVFRAVGKGTATVAFAATKGDASGRAVKASTTKVTVR
jgi:hypothetical protein